MTNKATNSPTDIFHMIIGATVIIGIPVLLIWFLFVREDTLSDNYGYGSMSCSELYEILDLKLFMVSDRACDQDLNRNIKLKNIEDWLSEKKC